MLLRVEGQGLSHQKHKPLKTATAELVCGERQTEIMGRLQPLISVLSGLCVLRTLM